MCVDSSYMRSWFIWFIALITCCQDSETYQFQHFLLHLKSDIFIFFIVWRHDVEFSFVCEILISIFCYVVRNFEFRFSVQFVEILNLSCCIIFTRFWSRFSVSFDEDFDFRYMWNWNQISRNNQILFWFEIFLLFSLAKSTVDIFIW